MCGICTAVSAAALVSALSGGSLGEFICYFYFHCKKVAHTLVQAMPNYILSLHFRERLHSGFRLTIVTIVMLSQKLTGALVSQ